MDECIFCRIISRDIPAEIVDEDEHTLAFLDAAPNTRGHTLVIPKTHTKNIFDVSEEVLDRVMHTVRRVSPAVRDAVGARGVHVNSNHEAEAGQVVFHLHFHIIPRHSKEEFEFWPKIACESGESAAIAEKVRAVLAH